MLDVNRARKMPSAPPGNGLGDFLTIVRRYAEYEAVRLFGSFFAVAAVVIIAGLAWLWLLGK